MYGPLRLCKAFGADDIDSLLKCIRPLASELLLQPGHDEIHTLRSQILWAGTEPSFPKGLTKRRSTVSSSSHEPRKLNLDHLNGGEITPLVKRSRFVHDHPRNARNFRGECDDDLIDMHPLL